MLVWPVRARVNDNSLALCLLVSWGPPTATHIPKTAIRDCTYDVVLSFFQCELQYHVSTMRQSGVSRTSAHPPLTHATRHHCRQLAPLQAARNKKHAMWHPLQAARAAEACAWHAFQTSVYTQRLQTEMLRNGASYDAPQRGKGHLQYKHQPRIPF
jgi:hypothetical protein